MKSVDYGCLEESTCRVCGSKDLIEVLYLGKQPLANALKVDSTDEENHFDLTLVMCSACSLVQIRETVSKEALFKKYFWVTGTSAGARSFAEELCDLTWELGGVCEKDLVVEVASNDGTFLQPHINRGARAVGVDPAENIAELANSNGIHTICSFWNPDVARKVRDQEGAAKVVIARNVVPHVSELHDVVSAIALCLADDGVGFVEFHYAGRIFDDLQYDAIYHEHLCYFSVGSFANLLRQHGLHPFHAIHSPLSGGAMVVAFSLTERALSQDYQRLVDLEQASSLNSVKTWQHFGEKCRQHREASRSLLDDYMGHKVVGFGASARSSTFLNFCGFSTREIQFVVDNNQLKHGYFTPGSSIPIVSFEEGFSTNPDLVFVMAWNFSQEVMSSCSSSGYKGSFLLPFPGQPHIVECK